jgi:hypothetical protein
MSYDHSHLKTTYEDFIADNPNCSKYKDCPDARRVFTIMSQDENIIKMIEAADTGKPALLGCVDLLEECFDYDPPMFPTFDFRDDFTRTVVGRMVKSILAPFGYLVLEPNTRAQKDFPKSAGVRYFKSASCYEKTGPAVLEVRKHIGKV